MTDQSAAYKQDPTHEIQPREAGYDDVRNPQLRLLREAWEAALAEKRRRETDAAHQAEQCAYDALIDYIEAHSFNATRWDPR